MRRLKQTLKRLGPLYSALFWTYRFGSSLGEVRVDLFPIRKTVVLVRGGPELSAELYRFYSNFMEGLAIRTRRTGKRFLFVDVGANSGWFAKTILWFSPGAHIVSYEPLQSQHSFLDELKHRYPNFCYRPWALGDKAGVLTLSELGTSGLSSLRALSNNYRYGDRYDARVVDSYPVEVRRLDDEIGGILETGRRSGPLEFVLKIDTQGFEFEVLSGAADSLRAGIFQYIIIELMTVEKYAGSRLYPEIISLLHGYGYRLWDVIAQQYESSTRQMSEFDAIFVLEEPSVGPAGVPQ